MVQIYNLLVEINKNKENILLKIAKNVQYVRIENY